MNKKFILISGGRSGTTFLMRALAEDKRLRSFEREPFHANYNERALVDGEKWIEGTSSADFVYNRIFKSDDTDIRAVGFKLFFFHCRQDILSADLWRVIKSDKDIKIIFLTRKSLLERHFSEIFAEQTGVWHPDQNSRNYGDDRSAVYVDLDIGRMMKSLYEHFTYLTRLQEEFRQHDVLNFFYEDIYAKGSSYFIQKIYSHLDLPVFNPTTPFFYEPFSSKKMIIVNEKNIRIELEKSIFAYLLEYWQSN